MSNRTPKALRSLQVVDGVLVLAGQPVARSADAWFTSAGLQVSREGASRLLRWAADDWDVGRFSPDGTAVGIGVHAGEAAYALAETWPSRVYDERRASVVPLRPDDRASDGVWDAIQLLWALRWGLHDRPERARHLDDPARVAHLVRDLTTWPAPQVGVRLRRHGEARAAIVEALDGAGHVHELVRPWPGWEPPAIAEVVAEVQGSLDGDPRRARITEEVIVAVVAATYLEVRPWPFAALAE